MGLIEILLYPKSGANALHIVIALNYFTFVSNVVWVLVELVKLAMVKVDRINCLLCNSKLLMEKTPELLFPIGSDNEIVYFGFQ